ncbi:hypothetical protein Leryth_019533 [Lithospermum erythrorhizon]|nr:hypothetical protein Leryth_019533 [Lithospermum erythrorhizon]
MSSESDQNDAIANLDGQSLMWWWVGCCGGSERAGVRAGGRGDLKSTAFQKDPQVGSLPADNRVQTDSVCLVVTTDVSPTNSIICSEMR